MLSFDHVRARWVATALMTVLLLAVQPLVAAAQESTPTPEIASAPSKVGYGKTATIKVRLQNGAPGDEVALQRRRPDFGWTQISAKPVDSDLEAIFNRRDMKRGTLYRAVYLDEVAGTKTTSSVIKVRVAPKLTFRVRPNEVFKGRTTTLRGRLLPVVAETRHVVFKQKVAGEWRWIKKVAVGKDGYFRTSFDATRTGYRRMKVSFAGDWLNTQKKRVKTLTVYEPDSATWYGPGFYGNRTACGQRMSSEILGVAHRSLPCGTKVSILYEGRTITVPVIDRGPYSHANWDLTQETAERLGFEGTDTVGVTR